MPVVDPKAIEELDEARRAIDKEWTVERRDRWHAALNRVWNPLLLQTYESFRKGDCSVSPIVVDFLDEDPVFFRSGYAKEMFLQKLRREHVTKKDVIRLRKICLRAVDSCSKREYRRYCRLAARIADEEMVKTLRLLLRVDSGAVKSRARMMINAIARHGEPGLAEEIVVPYSFLELAATWLRRM